MTRNRIKESLQPSELVPGDVVHLTLGMEIPADIRIIDGESDTISLSSEPCSDHHEINNICYFGGLVVNGKGKGVVIATGNDTLAATKSIVLERQMKIK